MLWVLAALLVLQFLQAYGSYRLAIGDKLIIEEVDRISARLKIIEQKNGDRMALTGHFREDGSYYTPEQ